MAEHDGRVPAEPGSREPSPSVSAASGFDPARDEWPEIKYDDCYPADENFAFWTATSPKPNFGKAARWLLSELPRAAEHMLCFCEVGDSRDIVGKRCKLVKFSTGGWSGAESIIALIERRFDLSYFMLSWKRGGHYVFEIPLARLRDSDGSGEAGQTAKQAGPKATARAEGIAQPSPESSQ